MSIKLSIIRIKNLLAYKIKRFALKINLLTFKIIKRIIKINLCLKKNKLRS